VQSGEEKRSVDGEMDWGSRSTHLLDLPIVDLFRGADLDCTHHAPRGDDGGGEVQSHCGVSMPHVRYCLSLSEDGSFA